MTAAPPVATDLDSVCVTSEPFSERSINALFRAYILAAGIECETTRNLLFEFLWTSDRVLSAIHALQDAQDACRDTRPALRHLLAAINAEILQLA